MKTNHVNETGILWDVDDVAAAIKCGKTTAWQKMRTGQIASIRVGTRLLARPSAVEAYIARLEETSSVSAAS